MLLHHSKYYHVDSMVAQTLRTAVHRLGCYGPDCVQATRRCYIATTTTCAARDDVVAEGVCQVCVEPLDGLLPCDQRLHCETHERHLPRTQIRCQMLQDAMMSPALTAAAGCLATCTAEHQKSGGTPTMARRPFLISRSCIASLFWPSGSKGKLSRTPDCRASHSLLGNTSNSGLAPSAGLKC